MPWTSILWQTDRSGQWLNQAAHYGSDRVGSQGLSSELSAPRGRTHTAWTPLSSPAAYLDPGPVSQGKGTRRPPPP